MGSRQTQLPCSRDPPQPPPATEAAAPPLIPQRYNSLELSNVYPDPQPSRVDHGPQWRGRFEPAPGDPGGARHAARRRQRNRCIGSNLAHSRRRRTRHVRPRRRRISTRCTLQKTQHLAATTQPVARRSPPRRNASAPAASRCEARSASPLRDCSAASVQCMLLSASCHGTNYAPPPSSTRVKASPSPTITGISRPMCAPYSPPIRVRAACFSATWMSACRNSPH